MSDSKKEFFERYARYAQEQMVKYGIPASVTLAQAAIESGYGNSTLAQNNAFFGVKAPSGWRGKYILLNDDRPNEKFCTYGDAAASFEHHSLLLMRNKSYNKCWELSSDDSAGWAAAIKNGGYATDPQYAEKITDVIKKYGLDKYDKEVIGKYGQDGVGTGNPRLAAGAADGGECSQEIESLYGTFIESQSAARAYSFPVSRSDFLNVTSNFGMRTHPVTGEKNTMHYGIDIATRHDDLLATENGGVVTAVNMDTSKTSGIYVTVRYDRPDGSQRYCTYMHLSSVAVKEGDKVDAGDKLGVSGSTGRVTGEHLHFEVKTVSASGEERRVDPSSYLAEIAAKGGLTTGVMYNGKDLLAQYKPVDTGVENEEEETLSPDDWLKKLASSEGNGLGTSDDPVVQLLITAFMTLMAFAIKIDGGDDDSKCEAVTSAVLNKEIDFADSIDGITACKVRLTDGGMTVSGVVDGQSLSAVLSAQQAGSLTAILNDTSLTDTERSAKSAAVIKAVLCGSASQSLYDDLSDKKSAELGKGLSV